MSTFNATSEYTNSTLTYISGYVERKLLTKEPCLCCAEHLKNSKIKATSKFLNFVNRGNLVQPNSNLNLVVKVTNSCVEQIKKSSNLLQQKNILQRITCNVLSVLNSRHPNIFSALDSHVDVRNVQNCPSHKVLMLKKIVSCFLSIRLTHYCREFNESVLDKKLRRILIKKILLGNQ